MSKMFGALVLVAMLAIGTVRAATRGEDEARWALERGDIRPLSQILDVARKLVPGDVVKVSLGHNEGRWTYQIRILTEKGERKEVEIDASSLSALEVN
jgi:uncharacterized membrane protein YkoI